MKSCLLIAVFVLSSAVGSAWAVPSPAVAACNISCTVAEVAEWSNNSLPVANPPDSAAIDIDTSGSTPLVLYTNGDVEITADNPDTAQLSKDAFGKLLTDYELEYDGCGTDQTNSSTVICIQYDSFMSRDSTVRHIPSDGNVEITLSVEVPSKTTHPLDSGQYRATQTLTVCWKS